MYGSMRQNAILTILKKQGYATVRELTEALHYSTATINRDLNRMEEKGLIKRSYGGAELVKKTQYVPFPFRHNKMRIAKRHIAARAAEFVHDADTLYIDGTTTTQYMGDYLTDKKNLTVITNNITLATSLSELGKTTYCLGGKIVEAPSVTDGSFAGNRAIALSADKMFFSTGGITQDGRIAVASFYAPLLRDTMMRNSREIFLLMDHEKIFYQSTQSYLSFDLSAVDYVISDYEFDEEFKNRFPTVTFITVKSEEKKGKSPK